MRRRKYNAVKTKVDGYVFDSKAEARRYLELKELRQAGKIRSLSIHPRYELLPRLKTGTARCCGLSRMRLTSSMSMRQAV